MIDERHAFVYRKGTMRLALRGTFGDASLRHAAEVTMLAVAEDDSVVVAADGGHPGHAVVWDLATGAERLTVTGVRGLTAAAISRDGSLIAISGYDNKTIVFDAATGEARRSFTTRAAAHAMAFSPDGEWVLVGDDRIPRLLPLDGARESRVLKGHLSAVKAVAISPDGRFAVTAGGDRKIKLQDFAKGKVLATFEGYASMIAFTPDGRFVFAGFDCAGVVDVASRELRNLGIGYLDGAALSRDGRWLATRSGREQSHVVVRDLDDGEVSYERTFDPISRMALSSTGNRLILARSAMLAQGTSLEVWSLSMNERLLPRGGGHLGGIGGIAVYGTDVKVAVSASADRTLRLWDIEAAAELETIEGASELGAVAVAPDGSTAITTRGYGRESTLQRWDLRGMRVAGTLDTGELGEARDVAISPDGRFAAASFVRRAAVFDLASGAVHAVLEKHAAQIDAIRFSTDGRFVITGAADHLVKIWRTEDGSCVHTLAGHGGFIHALAALPDGTVISAGSDMFRWDIARGESLVELIGCGAVRTLAASPDGAWLVVLRPFNTTIELWSLANAGIAGPIHAETLADSPACAAFVDAHTLLVGTKQGGILRFVLQA